ncbi:iron ABC transporter [Gordonia sp. QH-12]|uniref:FecCD family ABC transporter permease n=1 Tax=Gordonia sp. QH-12 TaxID=1437876 RepID=UPI0007945066|nr:iron ABC transporter permease [Gordonia sp. QH-12]KXT58465.1 iron ABC transporter [Gordonia sp. QH-12]
MTPVRTSAAARRPRARSGVWVGLAVALLASLLVAAAVGSVAIPPAETLRVLTGGHALDAGSDFILREVRLPRIATAALVGAALGVAGLQMQTLFRNPLADPYVLGANSGASLGVALVALGGGVTGAATFAGGLAGWGRAGSVVAAAFGAAAVLGLILLFAVWVRSAVTLLLIGVMIGAVTGSLVAVLIVYADPDSVQKYMIWGLGTFSATSWSDLRVAAPVILSAVLLSSTSMRALNALLLGEEYARSMGVDLRLTRTVTLLSAAVLTGVVTAYCGPVGFLGLVIPHLARGVFRTSNHRVILPGCVLVGALLAIWCGIVADLPGKDSSLPLNAVTALIGAPVVITVLLRGRGNGGAV